MNMDGEFLGVGDSCVGWELGNGWRNEILVGFVVYWCLGYWYSIWVFDRVLLVLCSNK